MAELADADEEDDLEQQDDVDDDAEQTKYILKSTHEPTPELASSSTDGDDDSVGEWKAPNGKGKGSKQGAAGVAAGSAPCGDLALLYSRDEEVAAATGRAEACGHYEILKGTIDRAGMPSASTKVVNVVSNHASACLCVFALMVLQLQRRLV